MFVYPYTDGGVEMILSIYKYLPSIMALTHIGTEIYCKVDEECLEVKDGKILVKSVHR